MKQIPPTQGKVALVKKRYSIEQFPKNKDISNLSNEQNELRQTQKKFVYKDKFTCIQCGKTQHISEFYIKDKFTGRRGKRCRDCQIKNAGVIEVGKQRFAVKIFKKGFRRCSVCKKIKPITAFSKSKLSFGGYSNNCYNCSNEFHAKYIRKQLKEIGLFHIKQYGIRKGITEFTDEIINQLRDEIIKSREPKYFIDGKKFVTIKGFARYMHKRYGLPITMTEKRIFDGKTEEQCRLTEYEMRSLAYTQGRIEVKDTVTGEVFKFKNSMDKNLRKMFATVTITNCIKTGNKTRVTSLSKYKNPCIITRIS